MATNETELEELRRIAREATANVALLTAQLARSQPANPMAHKKKPDLPAFDPKNVEIWLQRVEAAYTRVGITEAKDKFAFLEKHFDVNFSAKINTFLFDADPSETTWQEFTVHLLTRYGLTRRQRAAKFVTDFPRNGKTPTEFLAHMELTGKDVTFDDVKKEHLLKSLPPRVREYLGKDADKWTAQEVADKADDYFDRDGRLLEPNGPTIHHVSDMTQSQAPSPQQTPQASVPYSTPSEEREHPNDGINAVKDMKGNSKRPSQPPPRPSTSSSGGSSSSNWRLPPPNPQPRPTEKLCTYHRRWKDNALQCFTGCSRFSEFMAAKNKQGNGKGSH